MKGAPAWGASRADTTGQVGGPGHRGRGRGHRVGAGLKKRTVVVALFVAVVGALCSTRATAEWEKSVALYLWAISMEGTQVVQGNPIEVDTSFSDILSDLDMAFTVHAEAKKDRWLALFDVNWGKLGPETPPQVEDLDVKFAFVELGGGYLLKEKLYLLFGARYITLDVEAVIGGLPVPAPSFKVGGDEDWIDPYIGLRYEHQFAEKWTVMLRSDVGGFGVGSDLAWNVAAFLERDLSRRTSLMLGAGYLDVDYEDGQGDELFVYDIKHTGLILAFNLTF